MKIIDKEMNMRKILIILVGVITAFSSFAQEGDHFLYEGLIYTITGPNTVITKEGIIEYNYYGDYNIYAGNDVSGDIVIPEKVYYYGKSYIVEGIGKYGFYDCSGLLSVKMPNNIKTIGYSAFSNAANLKTVKLSEGLEKIDERAFEGCQSLESLTFYNNLKTIDAYTFSGCTDLKEVKFSEVLNKIGNYAFYNCTNLKNVTFPKSLQEIGDFAFSGCSSIKSLNFPDNLLYIGEGAFIDCESVTTSPLVIHENMKSIKSNAFRGCDRITAVDFNAVYIQECPSAFPSSVTKINIGEKVRYLPTAFYGGLGMDSISIPDHILYLGNGFFPSSVVYVKLPNKLTKIPWGCFQFCSKLRTVELPESIVEIDGRAFYKSGIQTLNIPKNVIRIGLGAFSECEYLETITIPDNVLTMDNSIFEKCPNLETVIIGNGLTNVPYQFCYQCWSLKNIVLGCSVEEIGNYAFYDCPMLEKVELPNSVKIVECAFSSSWEDSANKIKEVVIPNSVKRLRSSFDRCPLETIIIGHGEPQISGTGAVDNIYVTSKTPPSYTIKKGATVYVLPEAMEAYQEDALWSSAIFYPLVAATSISVDILEIEGEPGDKIQLTASTFPEEATLHNVFWNTDNYKVAGVSTSGLVTLASEQGYCTITAQSIYPDVPDVEITVYNHGTPVEDGVEEIFENPLNRHSNDIFNLHGICIKRNATQDDISNLAPGIYIINGNKVAL